MKSCSTAMVLESTFEIVVCLCSLLLSDIFEPFRINSIFM